MSARNHSRNDAIKEIPTKVLTPKEMDSSCRRLARVPTKASNSSRNDSPDSFAINYFNNNPDVPLDKRSPQEKLDEINAKLNDLDLEENDRFGILVQKKAICSLAFGDTSPETFEALYQLGSFYNSQSRPESALRHLLKAQEVTKSIETSEENCFAVSVEIADSYLAIKPQNKSEMNRNINNAENVIKPFDEYDSEEKSLMFRKSLIQARIKVQREKYADAFSQYEAAYENLDSANKGKASPQTASLYVEMGDCAERGGDVKMACEMYQRAYDTFADLGMNDSAKMIEPKLTELQARSAQEKSDSSSSANSSRSSSRSSARSKSNL